MNPFAFTITLILVLIHFLILVIVIVPSHDSVCLRFEINLFDLPQTVYRHPAVRVDVTICPLNLHSSSETIYDPHDWRDNQATTFSLSGWLTSPFSELSCSRLLS